MNNSTENPHDPIDKFKSHSTGIDGVDYYNRETAYKKKIGEVRKDNEPCVALKKIQDVFEDFLRKLLEFRRKDEKREVHLNIAVQKLIYALEHGTTVETGQELIAEVKKWLL